MRPTSPDVSSTASADQGEPLIRVYNRSERSFILDDIDPETQKTKRQWKVTGGGFSKVPQRIAERLQRDYPRDIVGDEEAQVLVRGAQARADALQKENDELKAKLAALTGNPAAVSEEQKKVVEGLKAEIKSLKELIDKATSPL